MRGHHHLKVAMSPLTSVLACPLGDDATSDVSVHINLENQAPSRRENKRDPTNYGFLT
jgi:hypothetical protein